jgi:hypothetical protein
VVRKVWPENALLFFTLHTLKQNNLLKNVKRIFKFSARSELEDTFDISQYENLLVNMSLRPEYQLERTKRSITSIDYKNVVNVFFLSGRLFSCNTEKHTSM